MSLRIIFMGTPQFAVPSLEALLSSPHTVLTVVTQPDRPRGRGQRVTVSPVKAVAQKHRVPVIQPTTLRDRELYAYFRSLRPDIMVVVAYGKFLPASLLTLPPRGCINVHASLLPRLRGAAPINWALIRGETETGITIMQMNERMDAGDILLQRAIPIGERDTAQTLHDRLAPLGAECLQEALRLIEEGKAVFRPQEERYATYAPRLKKEDGHIDWTRRARDLYNLIRGVIPWPGAYTFRQGSRLKIWWADWTDRPV
ncbi:MAG: methionyl-tRNA formyltransferase, partial [Nitrospinota bacterium]